MTFIFRPAIRENVGLIIGLAGGTGSGKTFSALRLASGLAGSGKIAFIDTENGRGLENADQFSYDYGELRAPFRPDAYAEAIEAADKAGYPVIIVDSASHEHAGDGGLLDWHEEELDRMAGTDWKKREACNMAAWIKPKTQHKQFVTRLLAVKAHIILCFRAEPKVEMARDDNGKMKITAKQSLVGLDGWIPISEKSLPFELTMSFLLMAGKPGVPIPIKLGEKYRPYFPAGQPITENAGKELAKWAAGGQASQTTKEQPAQAQSQSKPAADVHGPITCTVGLVEVGSNGVANGKPWQVYYVLLDGTRYATFSETIYEQCSEAVNLGQSAEFYWKNGKNNQPVIDRLRIIE